MRRLVLGAAAALAFTPAAYGLIGNDSFAQDVPAQVPASAELFTPRSEPTTTGTSAPTSPTPISERTSEPGDDHGGDRDRDDRTEPGDDRDSDRPTGAATSGATASAEAGDDNGGARDRDDRTEPGDDRDSGPRSGSDSDSDSDSDSGRDSSGHGSDDPAGSDD